LSNVACTFHSFSESIVGADQSISDVPSKNGHTSAPSELAPPLLVKLTGYRILNMVLIATFVVAKAILTYEGRPSATVLDWLLGGVITIGQVIIFCCSGKCSRHFLSLWWLGLYESIDPPIWSWFFHDDYSYAVKAVFEGINCKFHHFYMINIK
jgi:hypothetical protein